jgi:hypothetical protein
MSDVNAVNITAAGTIIGGLGLTVQSVNAPAQIAGGSLSAVGAITGQSVSVPGSISSGTVNAVGAITGQNLSVVGAITGQSVSVPGSINSGTLNAVGAITGQSVSVPGLVSAGSLNTALSANIGTNLTVGGSLTVNGPFVVDSSSITVNTLVTNTFNCTGLNYYEGAIQSGDVVSVSTVGIVTPSQSNTYFRTLLAVGSDGSGGNTFWQDTSYNVIVNEIIYWCNTYDANSVQKQSATLLVPFIGANVAVPTGLPKNSAIVSCKHGTLASTYQYSTLWSAMAEVAAGAGGPSLTDVASDVIPWMLATTGYVSVCADNVAYGKSVGTYNFGNVADECLSQYYSIVATTQYMNLSPESFFNRFVGVSPVNVINSGYSLGGLNIGTVSQLIKNDDIRNPYRNTNTNTIPLNLIQTIAGAPINTYSLINSVVQQTYNSPAIWDVLLFALLGANNRTSPIRQSLRPNIIAEVVPVFDQFYSTTNINSVSLSQYGRMQAYFVPSVLAAYSTQSSSPGAPQYIYPPLPEYTQLTDTSSTPSGYWTPNQAFYNPYYNDCSANNVSLNAFKLSFYTNPFVDFSDLSGTPINVIYSTGDELACYNAGSNIVYTDTSSNIFIGTPSTDKIYTDYKAWVDSSNYLTVPSGIWTQQKTWVDVSGGLALGGFTSTSAATNPIAVALLATENQNKASVIRVNKDVALPASLENTLLRHYAFGIGVFQLGVRTYLINRT